MVKLILASLLCCTLSAQLTPRQESIRQEYNSTYLENQVGFNPAPNQFLVEVAEKLVPGRALDVGMGQGRNTVYLAGRGWRVTGVDLSDEGIRQARVQARKLKLNIETVQCPIESFDFGRDQWDLIVFCYLDPRSYRARIIAGLKPGGVVVVEGFDKRAAKTRLIAGWFDDNELLHVFPSLRILRYEDVLGRQDWGFQVVEPNRLVHYAAIRPVTEPPGCRWEGKAYKESERICWGLGQWLCDVDGWGRVGSCRQ